MNPLIEQLHDIEGLDAISSWPLAIGWWILIGIAVTGFLAIAGFVIYKQSLKRSWKGDALQNLAMLEKSLSDDTARETIIALSEYLRRIAIRRFSRQTCAGLAGEMWLKWLAKHDSKKFDWEKKGRLLIETPYMPEDIPLPVDQVRGLIHAAKHWVR